MTREYIVIRCQDCNAPIPGTADVCNPCWIRRSQLLEDAAQDRRVELIKEWHAKRDATRALFTVLDEQAKEAQ